MPQLSAPNAPVCPVCEADQCRFFLHVEQRDYWRCSCCEATFLQPEQRLNPANEFAEYQLPDNNPADPGYRQFLNRVAAPLLERLPPAQQGLDFGCGPGPALANLLREAGHSVALFDPFFFPEKKTLEQAYDFITCTEVAEHFHRPAAEFHLLNTLLKPGGWLALMTCFQTDDDKFANWHYRRDPTHVVFYREKTFSLIAQRFGWQCEFPAVNVALMHKPRP